MMSREYAGFTAGATGSVYAVELDGALKQECGIEPSEGDELRRSRRERTGCAAGHQSRGR